VVAYGTVEMSVVAARPRWTCSIFLSVVSKEKDAGKLTFDPFMEVYLQEFCWVCVVGFFFD
jgi:hypothetical protein